MSMTNENVVQTSGTQPEAIDREMRVAPPVDVYENADEILMLVDVPGVSEDGVQLRLEARQLDLEARQRPSEVPGFAPVVFARSFTLPAGIDHDGVGAELNQGVLRIRLRKSAEAKPRRIPVKSS